MSAYMQLFYFLYTLLFLYVVCCQNKIILILILVTCFSRAARAVGTVAVSHERLPGPECGRDARDKLRDGRYRQSGEEREEAEDETTGHRRSNERGRTAAAETQSTLATRLESRQVAPWGVRYTSIRQYIRRRILLAFITTYERRLVFIYQYAVP